MKLVHGYWMPSEETREDEIVATSVSLGRPAYQHHKLEAALEFCPLRRTALDVGAHIGMWSMQFARAGFQVIHAFDPDPIKTDCYLRNYDAHAIQYGAEAFHYNVGLGDRETSATLVVPHGTTLKTHVRPSDTGSIPICTLDSYAIADVDFLKIDTEGFELFVVRGAEQTIRTNLPVIVVEQKKTVATRRYGVGDTDAVQLLQSWGYETRAEFNGDYVLTPR